MESISPPATSRLTYSCVRCSNRKVKCDRQNPCTACVKHNAQCIFRPHQPSQKRSKRFEHDTRNDRLKRYEALLTEAGIDLERTSENHPAKQHHTPGSVGGGVAGTLTQLPTPASTTSEDRSLTKTQIVHGEGRQKFVDKYAISQFALFLLTLT